MIKMMRKTSKSLIRTLIPSAILWRIHDLLIYKPQISNLGINDHTTPLFQSVFFEVRTRCNGLCSFCAANIQDEIREDMSMPFELYAKVIDELEGIKYRGRIAYHVNNEPLLFKDLTNFVSYAREKLPNAWIQILSNGKSLGIKKGDELVTAGINELTINHYTDDLSAPLPKRLTEFKEKVLLNHFKPEQIGAGHRPTTGDDGVFRFNILPSRVDEVKNSRAGTAPNKNEE